MAYLGSASIWGSTDDESRVRNRDTFAIDDVYHEGMDDIKDEVRPELVTFTCREAYVYKAPPASTVGHRAELWDVDNPMQEVACSVVTSGDQCWVRLTDKTSGELFAECPIVKDKPLTASVESVVDSSRYFVLRVADRESGRHAFLGFGFRERSHATNFTAALSDHIGYLRRQQEARQMQEAFQAAQAGQQGPNLPTLDFSLKPGETVNLKLADKAPVPRSAFMSKRLAAMTAPGTGQSGALLPPPPTAARLEPRSLSGPLHEDSSPAEAAPPDGSEKSANEAAESQERRENSAAAMDSVAARSAQQHEQQQHVLASSVRHEGKPDDDEEEQDDQFGSFIVA